MFQNLLKSLPLVSRSHAHMKQTREMMLAGVALKLKVLLDTLSLSLRFPLILCTSVLVLKIHLLTGTRGYSSSMNPYKFKQVIYYVVSIRAGIVQDHLISRYR
uniref:Uncharacterized protein n=1 Tax=Amphimedon queenslandica TaxID=400682 RepID=A0A1X7UYQ6_AMPQE